MDRILQLLASTKNIEDEEEEERKKVGMKHLGIRGPNYATISKTWPRTKQNLPFTKFSVWLAGIGPEKQLDSEDLPTP